jgi:hypothetical protein
MPRLSSQTAHESPHWTAATETGGAWSSLCPSSSFGENQRMAAFRLHILQSLEGARARAARLGVNGGDFSPDTWTATYQCPGRRWNRYFGSHLSGLLSLSYQGLRGLHLARHRRHDFAFPLPLRLGYHHMSRGLQRFQGHQQRFVPPLAPLAVFSDSSFARAVVGQAAELPG